MAIAKVENYNGAPALLIDGKVYPPMFATIRTVDGDVSRADEDYYRHLGESGIKIFFLICDTEWLKPGAFQLFKEEAELLLRAVPDAYIVMRLGMHAPPAWCKENPDETLTYSDGKKKSVSLFTESFRAEYTDGFYSFASKKWRADAAEALKDTHKRVSECDFADRVIGYFFAAGGTSEWYYPTPMCYTEKTNFCDSGGFRTIYNGLNFPDVYGDLSPAFRRSFTEYLTEKYKTDEALQQAWKQNDVTLDNPKIPDHAARYHIYEADYDALHAEVLSNAPDPVAPSNENCIGQFLNIEQRRDVFDFFRALHLATAEAVVHFGKVVKSLDPNKVTGAFYGSAGSVRFYDFAQIGSTDHILKSGVIDFLASPSVYENRGPGGIAGQRQNFDSYRLKNAIFVVEDDVRTHMEKRIWRSFYDLYTLEDSLGVMKRDFGRNLSQNLYSWWFDQILGGKRYKVPEMYPVLKKMQELAHEAFSKDRTTASEIALIYDEESYHVISDLANQELIEYFRYYEVDKVGAPIDRYLHNDMSYDEMPDYKLYIFVNTLYLSDEERELIKRKLRKNGATALFLYGSGVINPDRSPMLCADHITDLTGIKVELTDGIYFAKYRITGENELTCELPDDEIYGDYKHTMVYNSSSYFGKRRELTPVLFPLLAANDPDAEVLGVFLDSEKDAIVRKAQDGFTSIYAGTKNLTFDVVRAIARGAGCHIYSDSGDVLYTSRSFITHHASRGGEKVICLPRSARVTEVYEDACYGENVKEIRFRSRKGETKTFRIEYL